MSQLFLDECPKGFNGRKVMLATPVYDNPDVGYTFSIQNSRFALHDKGIGTAFLLLAGNCHVDDSRNAIVREFLASDCTDLVFLDSDVCWEAESLLELVSYEVGPLDVVGGVYPYRRESGHGIPVLNLDCDTRPSSDGLVEVKGLPTGFMRIRRPLLDKMVAVSPSFRNKAGVTIPLIFERTIVNGLRYGGDIGFCLKAREMGGRVYAASEIRLGHSFKATRWGSYASSVRARTGSTLAHVAHRIRYGGFTPDLLSEAVASVSNPFGATEEVLAIAIGFARKADKPILELGSGLSSVLMAAATSQTVHCLEHSMLYAHQTQAMLDSAQIKNVDIYVHPLVDGFYKVPDGLPDEFSFLFVDGPPRHLGTRSLFSERIENIPGTILFDDADSHGFRLWSAEYAEKTGRKILPIPLSRPMVMTKDAA